MIKVYNILSLIIKSKITVNHTGLTTAELYPTVITLKIFWEVFEKLFSMMTSKIISTDKKYFQNLQ